ncbi:diguanylate cyclase domain-containing protein, partial [Modestobacter roseus]
METIRFEQSQDVLVQTAAVVAAQRQFAQRLRQRTVPDPLTGLPVRSLLIDRLELALAAAGPDTGRLAVLSCNLDGITTVEDTHGRLLADAARAEAAGRLVSVVRQGDVVARISAQTFVLLCP